MRWSFRILTISGIGIYLHITFLMLVAYLATLYFIKSGGIFALQGTALIISIFGCVLLHELGHALTAKRFGIRTKDIILLPIGGVARLERIPREPGKEFLIAIAGPLVNVAIAGVLLAALWVVGWSLPMDRDSLIEFARPQVGLRIYVIQLLAINVWMVIFNLIPAFPMDGGRILRSALAAFLDYTRATRIAAAIGQGFAVLFGLYGIFYELNPLFLLLAVFVFLGASGEAAAVQLRAAFRGLPTAAGMMRDFRFLERGDTLGHAVDLLLGGSQVDFPIIEDGRVTGVLTRQQLVQSLKERGPETPVGDVPLKTVEPVEAGAPLHRTYEEMGRQGVSCLPVLENGKLAGWITSENIAEVAMVREALGGHTGGERNALGIVPPAELGPEERPGIKNPHG